MRFSLIPLLVSLPLTLARLRLTEVIDLLDSLRRESTPLVRTSALLDLDNFRLLIRLRGPWQEVVSGLTNLTYDTKSVERKIKTLHSSSRSERFTGLDAADISEAFHRYVVSQIDLPSQLLEVASLVRNERTVGNALAPLLKEYRDAVDDLTDTLADRVDDVAKDAIKDDGKIVDEALKAVEDAYKGVGDGSGISLSLSLGLGRGRFQWEEVIPGQSAEEGESAEKVKVISVPEDPEAAEGEKTDEKKDEEKKDDEKKDDEKKKEKKKEEKRGEEG
ncbi:hypothetical protein QBC38DRAFT_252621 [Podospora fimiseda]|uniref:Uncharacterized protein n=1 Tax=Podospora fimiseda TaxID=252190 RepID=A0AAN7BMJ2_9PEZI|nr:hypothetical protein QBC38DRAFT_252621 [Podospora fimiseda]